MSHLGMIMHRKTKLIRIISKAASIPFPDIMSAKAMLHDRHLFIKQVTCDDSLNTSRAAV